MYSKSANCKNFKTYFRVKEKKKKKDEGHNKNVEHGYENK